MCRNKLPGHEVATTAADVGRLQGEVTRSRRRMRTPKTRSTSDIAGPDTGPQTAAIVTTIL
jgi:hypothetical protein